MGKTTIFECTTPPKNENRERVLYKTFNILKYIFIAFAIISAIIAFSIIATYLIFTLINLVLIVICLIIQYRFYNFYDYTVVENEIRVSKLINNKLRKGVIKFTTSKIIKIGFVGGEEFQKYNDGNLKIVKAKGGYLEEIDIYFLINYNGENKLVIFKFNQKFMSHLINLTTNKVLDGNFTENLKEYEKFNLS